MTFPKTMTLHYWLTVALKDLPELVQLRLEHEYRSHLLDSESPDDVRGVLGDPAEVNNQLSKLYGSAELWSKWQQPKQDWFAFIYICIAVIALLGVATALTSKGTELSLLIRGVGVLLISGMIWRYSARLALAKRQFLRSNWTFNAINLFLWSGFALDLWTGEDTLRLNISLVIVFPLLWLRYFWNARQDYLRLDRTLRLVGTKR